MDSNERSDHEEMEEKVQYDSAFDEQFGVSTLMKFKFVRKCRTDIPIPKKVRVVGKLRKIGDRIA